MAKNGVIFILCLFIGSFLRYYKISTNVPLIADQGWFYLSAINSLTTGTFPLTGITSSVVWLHQGSLFTYLLIPALSIASYHPASGAVLTAGLGVIGILLVYWIGRIWLGRKAGLIAAVLYSFSPLAVIHARTAYHTAPIPVFFSLFLLLVYKKRWFLAFLFLGFLYQLELASVVLWPVVGYYIFSNKSKPRLLDYGAMVIAILPLLASGWIQGTGVFVWSIYRLVFHSNTTVSMGSLYTLLISRFIFPQLPDIAIRLMILTAIVFALHRFRKIFLWFFFLSLALIINRTPSEAYFHLIEVPLIIILANMFSRFPRKLLYILILIYCVSNSYFLISRQYLLGKGGYGPSLESRIKLAKKILSLSNTLQPEIVMSGPGNKYESYDDPYLYLIWWLSRDISPSGKHSGFLINEPDQTIRVLE